MNLSGSGTLPEAWPASVRNEACSRCPVSSADALVMHFCCLLCLRSKWSGRRCVPLTCSPCAIAGGRPKRAQKGTHGKAAPGEDDPTVIGRSDEQQHESEPPMDAHGKGDDQTVIGRSDEEQHGSGTPEPGSSQGFEASHASEEHGDSSRGEDGGVDLPRPPRRAPADSGQAGPPEWLDEARLQMRDSNPHRRREALSFVLKRVRSAGAEVDGSCGAPVVHKAVLRAVASLLLDGVLTVREEARGTLDKLSTCYPHMRSLCIKYAGQQLTTAAPAR